MQRYKAFVFLGAPGCGKGTQGRALGALPGFFHCACGNVFRSLSSDTNLGRRVAQFSNKGKLVPDSITIELWKGHIQNCVRARTFEPDGDVLILDGIPRNARQARLLDEALDVKALFHFRCDDHSELVYRVQRRALREHRVDDMQEEVIRVRLKEYDDKSKALIRYYAAKPIYNINSQQRPVEVLYDILNHVRRLASMRIGNGNPAFVPA